MRQPDGGEEGRDEEMQKIMSALPSWDTTKTGSKKGFDTVWAWTDKLGAPVNKLTNKIGSEAFWPTTLDKESDKAARILKSFCSTCSSRARCLAVAGMTRKTCGKQRVNGWER